MCHVRFGRRTIGVQVGKFAWIIFGNHLSGMTWGHHGQRIVASTWTSFDGWALCAYREDFDVAKCQLRTSGSHRTGIAWSDVDRNEASEGGVLANYLDAVFVRTICENIQSLIKYELLTTQIAKFGFVSKITVIRSEHRSILSANSFGVQHVTR